VVEVGRQDVWFDLQTPRSEDFWIAGVNAKLFF
jgi:hypothetical protein